MPDLPRAPRRLAAPRRSVGGVPARRAPAPQGDPSHEGLDRRRRACCSRSGWLALWSGRTGRCTTWPRATSTRSTWSSTCCSPSSRRRCSSPACRRGCGAAFLRPRRSSWSFRFLTRPLVALDPVQRRAAVHPLARGGRRVGALGAHALHAPRAARGLGDRDVVAGDVAARRSCRPLAAAGADALPVPPVARADDPGLVPHVRAQPLYPVYATFPRIWGISALERPADRRAR